MARREVKEVHTSDGGSSGGFGILGVIIGALVVLGAVFFFAGGTDMFAGKSGGSSVTINAPSAPATPSAPRAPATTGSGTVR